MTSNKYYVTTTIPFVNARPHIGFALELVQADAFVRYSRLIGREVRFQTGTDENAFKNVQAAENLGIPTLDFVNNNSDAFLLLCKALSTSHDRFIRTTSPEHEAGVRLFWNRIRDGDLYSKKYRGSYCIGCEDFLLEKDLENGRCQDHGTRPDVVEEENIFFRLSAYQTEIENLISTDRLRVIPQKRKNEVLRFVQAGLHDISVSRATNRLGGWGIKVPNLPSQTIYVWIDALVNYLSGLGYGRGDGWKDRWNERCRIIHIIGKNVWKFHAVYWPALLLSVGLPIPEKIVVHGFLQQNGRKISKSLGNTIDPIALVNEFGNDVVRYYLLRHVRPFDDSDIQRSRLVEVTNELANGIGNLLSRLTALCEKSDYSSSVVNRYPQAPDGFRSALEAFEYDQALVLLWKDIRALNRDIERSAPWSQLLLEHRAGLHRELSGWLERLYAVAYWLEPFLPDSSERIKTTLTTSPITKSPPLFRRVNT